MKIFAIILGVLSTVAFAQTENNPTPNVQSFQLNSLEQDNQGSPNDSNSQITNPDQNKAGAFNELNHSLQTLPDNEPNDLLRSKIDDYMKNAKQLSEKNMTPEEVRDLSNKAYSILSDIRNQAFSQMGGNNFVLRYLNGKAFPDMEEHKNNSEFDQKFVDFTIACNLINSKLDENLITKIVEKSPLEMLSILKEMYVFFSFISANPADYGHGVLRESNQNGEISVYATNDAILRIMKGIVFKYLLRGTKVYKVSRILSSFIKNNNFSNDELNKFIENLKRSTADDSRFSLHIPNTTFSLVSSVSNPNSLQSTIQNYITELNLYQKEGAMAEKSLHLNRVTEIAKQLLGINANVNLKTFDKIQEICRECELRASTLSENINSTDNRTALKAKRDTKNLTEIVNFLKSASKLFDSLYQNTQLIDLFLEKIPEFLPVIDVEISIMLRVLSLKMDKDYSLDKVIEKMRSFAKVSDDGTYLLSPVISIAMNAPDNADFVKILNEINFSNPELCKYLKIR